jgi:hypothetical protein
VLVYDAVGTFSRRESRSSGPEFVGQGSDTQSYKLARFAWTSVWTDAITSTDVVFCDAADVGSNTTPATKRMQVKGPFRFPGEGLFCSLECYPGQTQASEPVAAGSGAGEWQQRQERAKSSSG